MNYLRNLLYTFLDILLNKYFDNRMHNDHYNYYKYCHMFPYKYHNSYTSTRHYYIPLVQVLLLQL